jgi:uncharacterized lipoprotein YddW (UPF0748 family)
MLKKIFFASILLYYSLIVCAYEPKREMRAVWITTVSNLDWPSQKGLSNIDQQMEMIQMLDNCKAQNINTIVFQVRPCGDVFYKSTIETWSMWLSGKQGIPPDPFYDPLQFIINEAHKRCMEVHAWVNPYRALNYDDVNLFNKNHLYFKQKELFVKYGNKYYFNPGLQETQDYLNNIIKELVKNYDIDAIHFDDYFYPYPIAGEPFPDEQTFRKNPRGFTHKSDWRRDNITQVIKQLQTTIKGIKPWVEFGVSPFGVWRHSYADPRGSATKKSLSNYDDLYADVLKWLKEGYIDYVVPQLYWEIGNRNHDYKVLLDWWANNLYGRNLYTGLYVCGFEEYKNSVWHKPNEIIRQMNLNRNNPNVKGEMFFRVTQFLKNYQNLNTLLVKDFYQYPSLVPENQSIKGEVSPQPKTLTIKDSDHKYLLCWDSVEEKLGKQISFYVVYAFKGKEIGDISNAENIVALSPTNEIDITDFCSKISGNYTFAVSSVNKYKRESSIKIHLTRKF